MSDQPPPTQQQSMKAQNAPQPSVTPEREEQIRKSIARHKKTLDELAKR